jgi:hypothetical protein
VLLIKQKQYVNTTIQADFKWERGAGYSKSNGTGPPFDHTTFNKNGHYLFINSTLHNVNEKAHLVKNLLNSDPF